MEHVANFSLGIDIMLGERLSFPLQGRILITERPDELAAKFHLQTGLKFRWR